MTWEQVLAILDLLTSAGVEAWVDGGWGVDALVGCQTREHSDLDLVVPVSVLWAARRALEGEGFEVERDWLPTAIAFRHPDGREVDLHVVEPTAEGGGEQVQLDGVRRFRCEPPVVGAIGGREVRCCSASTQVRAHLGYEPTETDYADMRCLRDHLDVTLPAPFDRV